MAEENLREDVFPRWDDAFIDDADPVPVAAAPAADVSDLRYRALVRNLPDTVVSIHDHDLRLVTMEGARLSEADFDAERMIGQPLSAYLPERDVQELEPHYRAALAGEPRSLEFQPSRRETIYHLEIVPLRMQEGDEPLGVFTVARDVTERRRARRAEEQRSAQQAAIATLGVAALEGREIGDLMDEAVTIVASTLGVELCELLQMTADHEALVLRAGVGWQPGLVRTALVPLGSEFYAGFAWGSRGQLAVEDWAAERRCSRTTLAMEHGVASTIAVVLGGKRRPLGVLAAHSSTERAFRRDEMDFVQAVANVLAEAISRQDAEDRVRHQALHDPLTELPNRTLLLERLGHWVGRAERTQARAALVFVDLDHFKVVNDALGHSVGDELLRRVADRLRAETRGSDTVARVGGDEFIVLSEDIGSEHEALALADRLAAALKPPFNLAGREQYVTASMGLAFSEPGADADALVRDADAAMYRAKQRGRARCEVYDQAMRERSNIWIQTEIQLRQAIENGELMNYYQPIVSADDGRVVGFEALVRWQHPERGLVSPGEFIPVAEQSGLIVPIGDLVLRQACFEAVRWQEVRGPGKPALRVSVNLSPRQLSEPDVVETVERALADSGLSAGLLSLEITETMLLSDTTAAMETLARLKTLGVRLDLDDFGTGYSSLTYVRQFPIGALKIDRSFVAGLGESIEDAAIVNAVISMARALDVSVVAEGVESEEQAATLRGFGCGLAQGFLFSRPLPATEIDPLLDA